MAAKKAPSKFCAKMQKVRTGDKIAAAAAAQQFLFALCQGFTNFGLTLFVV